MCTLQIQACVLERHIKQRFQVCCHHKVSLSWYLVKLNLWRYLGYVLRVHTGQTIAVIIQKFSFIDISTLEQGSDNRISVFFWCISVITLGWNFIALMLVGIFWRLKFKCFFSLLPERRPEQCPERALLVWAPKLEINEESCEFCSVCTELCFFFRLILV